MTPPPDQMTFPYLSPPEPLELRDVAPGIIWVRLALPFRLDHVNIYLVEDGPGFAVIDTGIGNAATEATWQALLGGVLRDRPVTRIIVTHFHPDHVGMAGWLCERTRAPLLMSQTDYLGALNIRLDPDALNAEPYFSFYTSQGLDEAVTRTLLTKGQDYMRMVHDMPRTFFRLIAGDTLRLGTREFQVLSGGGHAPEQIMLYCPADKLFLAADQVLARISPNISVQAIDPLGDTLGLYLRSLAELRASIPADALVLPGHNLPFMGLHTRIDELMAHHQSRCAAISDACSKGPQSAMELMPVVFRRPVEDPHQMGFAFGEVLAHVNYLRRRGELRFEAGRYRTMPG